MGETYTINLNAAKMASQNKRAGRAINLIKEYLRKHVGEDFKISKNINEEIWKRGANKPPKKIQIEVTEREDGSQWIDKPGTKPEEAEKTEEEKVEESKEEKEEKVKLPEEVKEALKEGTIDEGKEALKEINKNEFEKALNFEESHKNRKGMKQFIESNMR